MTTLDKYNCLFPGHLFTSLHNEHGGQVKFFPRGIRAKPKLSKELFWFFVSGRYGLPWKSVKDLRFRRTLLTYRTSGAHGTPMWKWPAGRNMWYSREENNGETLGSERWQLMKILETLNNLITSQNSHYLPYLILMFTFRRRFYEEWQRAMSPQITLHLVETRGTRTLAPLFMPIRASSEWIFLLPHAAMATRLLCCVTLCLLGVRESPQK